MWLRHDDTRQDDLKDETESQRCQYHYDAAFNQRVGGLVPPTPHSVFDRIEREGHGQIVPFVAPARHSLS